MNTINRATHREENGRVSINQGWTQSGVMNRLAAYEDTGLEPEEITGFLKGNRYTPNGFENETLYGKPLRHWGELATAEQEGRLVVLPCKVGNGYVTHWMPLPEPPTEPKVDAHEG